MALALTRNAVHVLPQGGLEAKLARKRPLRVKFGIDVTAPHIHLGNGIPLQRMQDTLDYHSSPEQAAQTKNGPPQLIGWWPLNEGAPRSVVRSSSKCS